jgi:hypothetical protein
MLRRIAATAWIAWFPICPASRCQPLGNPRATVNIHVVDEFGRTLSCRLEKFTEDGSGGIEYAYRFEGLKGTRLPHGNYIYLLRRNEPGLPDDLVSGKVAIDEPEVLLLIRTKRVPDDPHISHDDNGPFVTYRGKLDPMPPPGESGEPVWIKLTSVESNLHKEVGVDPSGEFRIYDWLFGNYILSVIRGGEVLHVQPITFESWLPPPPFVVKMPPTPPSMMRLRQEPVR